MARRRPILATRRGSDSRFHAPWPPSGCRWHHGRAEARVSFSPPAAGHRWGNGCQKRLNWLAERTQGPIDNLSKKGLHLGERSRPLRALKSACLSETSKPPCFPFDLTICALDDPPDLFAPDRFAFDTVMLVEGVVPTVGVHVKFVQKLVAGYATVAFSGAAPFDPTFDPAAGALEELAYAAHNLSS